MYQKYYTKCDCCGKHQEIRYDEIVAFQEKKYEDYLDLPNLCYNCWAMWNDFKKVESKKLTDEYGKAAHSLIVAKAIANGILNYNFDSCKDIGGQGFIDALEEIVNCGEEDD